MSQAREIPASQRIKQKRGQQTYDALVATGFRLLAKSEFESISIAELSQAAGYSVGAFYARFKSKDEFLEALMTHHIEERGRARERLFDAAPDDAWVDDLVADCVRYYWKRRRFWRAALLRSVYDRDFWQPLRKHGQRFTEACIERIGKQAKRPLTQAEETNVRFAVEILIGSINHAIINGPGPLFMGEKLFIEHLARAFRLVSGFDEIVGVKKGRKAS